MNSLPLVVFLFFGHSNLDNACAGICVDSISERVWAFGEEKKVYKPTNLKGGMYLFLNEMALRYPGYNFCGVDYSAPSQKVSEIIPGDHRYEKMVKDVAYLKTVSTIGGIFLLYGFIEAADKGKADNFYDATQLLIKNIRKQAGNDSLPCIMARYEKNHRGETISEKFWRYEIIIMQQIERIEKGDLFLKIAPVKWVPGDYHCEGHHQTCPGLRIVMEDAAVVYQQNNFDFWNKESK